jgi:hypothetical protein
MAAKRPANKRLTPSQVKTLEMLARYTDFTYLSTLRVLVRLGLAEEVRAWRITHDGVIVLKQNGYYPADPELRASVRKPPEAPEPRTASDTLADFARRLEESER